MFLVLYSISILPFYEEDVVLAFKIDLFLLFLDNQDELEI